MVDALRQRLAIAEEQNASDAARLQQLGLDAEALGGRLRTATEDVARERDAARSAQGAEAELRGKLQAREVELAELRTRLSSQTNEGMSLGANVAELNGRLALAESSLAAANDAKQRLEAEAAELPQLREQLAQVETAHAEAAEEAARVVELEAQCDAASTEVEQLRAEKEQMLEQLSADCDGLQTELIKAQEEVCDQCRLAPCHPDAISPCHFAMPARHTTSPCHLALATSPVPPRPCHSLVARRRLPRAPLNLPLA